MSTPTDPYNSGSRRPFDDDDSILDPIEETEGTADDDQAAWDRAFNSDDADDFARPDETGHDESGHDVNGQDDPALDEFDRDGLDRDGADPDADREVLDEEMYDADRERLEDARGVDDEHGLGDEHSLVDDRDLVDDRSLETDESLDAERDDNPTLGSFVADRNGETGRDEARPAAALDGDTTERNDLDALATDRAADESRNGPTRTSVMGAGVPTAAAATHTSADTPADAHDDSFVAAANDDERRERWAADPGEDALAEDVPEEPKGRGLAHFATVVLTLLLVPVAWYLIADAGARLSTVSGNPWDTGNLEIMPLLELLGGFVVLAVIWMMARASSLGAQVIGAIVAIAGIVALVVPTLGNDVVESLNNAIGGYNEFTGNVVYHLGNDLGSGRIATFGVILFLTGLAAHGARRRGQQTATAITRRKFLLGDQPAKKD